VRGFVVGLLALAAVAGCGGGDGGDRLSRAEFVSRADTICREYEARLDALGQPTNVDQLESFADRALPIAKDGREELGELAPPEDLEDTYDAWLEQGDEAIEIVERLRDAAADGDEAEIQRIAQEAERADAESNRLARELGFKQCGETASPSS
jgi:DNA-binding NtrC family response regulator